MFEKLPLPLFLLPPILVSGIVGCGQLSPCPHAPDPSTEVLPASAESVYRGSGDPYSPGPLSVCSIRLNAQAAGNPVPLLIIAPQTPGPYPVVVFQHGFMARNTAYSALLTHLATHGFVVVAPQMYEPGLSVLFGNPTAQEEAVKAAELLRWLPAGLPAVLGYSPQTARLGLAGHSRGAKVAWLVLTRAAAAAQDTTDSASEEPPVAVDLPCRAVAGVDPVDGRGGPRGNQARVVQGTFPFELPTLVIGCGLAGACAPAGDNHEQFYAASRPPAWHVVIADAGHADMLDDGPALAASLVCPSGPNRAAARQAMAGLLVTFFRASLQDQPSAYAALTDPAGAPLSFVAEVK